MQLALPPGPEVAAQFDTVKRLAEQAGRDPGKIGLEVWVSCAEGAEAEWREHALAWKRLGVTHMVLHNTFVNASHKRIAATDKATHLALMQRWIKAVGDI